MRTSLPNYLQQGNIPFIRLGKITLALMMLFSASLSFAQTTVFTAPVVPLASSFTNSTTQVRVAASDVTLTVYADGDFSSSTEVLDMTDEGLSPIGTFNGGSDCNGSYMVETFTIPQSSFNAHANDGTYEISFAASSSVNPTLCSPDDELYFTLEYTTVSAGDDAGITSIDSIVPACGTSSQDVYVTLQNFGNNPLTFASVDVQVYEVGNSTPLQTFSTTNSSTLDTVGGANDSETLLAGNFTFLDGINYEIVAYSSFPNGAVDTINSNDTSFTNFRSSLNGALSVGSGPSFDFQDLSSLSNTASQFGICGPVTVNVDSASGPFVGQVAFDNVAGASVTNTITINGNGAVIQYAPTSSERAIVLISNTDYITLNNLYLEGTDTDYGYGVLITDSSDYTTIDNCTIDLSSLTGTGFGDAAFITLSGSSSSSTTTGATGTNATISNNTLIGSLIGGPYHGICLNGDSRSTGNDNNEVFNNTLEDFYIYGIYINGSGNNEVYLNDFSRPNRTSNSTFYGVYFTNSSGCEANSVSRNRIHNPFGGTPTSTSTAYGAYYSFVDAPTGSPNIFDNNLIYDFTANGDQYGVYNFGSDGMHIYYNTISLDDQSSSSTNESRGIYQSSTASDIEIKNNIISITRGGSGTKHGLYFNATGSTISSDNNNIYVNSGSNDNFGYFGTDFSTLADWQSGTTYGSNSYNFDPLFVSLPNDLRPVPGSVTPLESGAVVIPEIGTPNLDFTGAARPVSGSAPDIGAYEFAGLLGDFSAPIIDSIAVSPDTSQCFATDRTVTVFVRDTIGAVDSVIINWSIAGASQTPINLVLAGGTVSDGSWTGIIPVNSLDPHTFNVKVVDTSVNANSFTSVDQNFQDFPEGASFEIFAEPDTVFSGSSSTLKFNAGNSLLITEVVQYSSTSAADGATLSYPAFLPTGDFDGIEIQNFSSSALSLAGYQVEFEGNVNGTFVFPSSATVPGNGLIFVLEGSGTDDPANGLYFSNVSGSISSSTSQGYILRDPSGDILDVVALNGYSFSSASGVTAQDWSGNIPNSSGDAGVSRTNADDTNDASDWTVASFAPVINQTFGTVNGGINSPGGLPAGQYSITWTGVNGLFTTGDSAVTGSIFPLGVNEFYGELTLNGCIVFDTTEIFVIDNTIDIVNPIIDSVVLNPDTGTCDPQSRFIDIYAVDSGNGPAGIDSVFVYVSATNEGGATFTDTLIASLSFGTALNGAWNAFLPPIPFRDAEVTLLVEAVDTSGNTSILDTVMYDDLKSIEFAGVAFDDSIVYGASTCLSYALGATLKFTEIVQFEGGGGSTSPYPAFTQANSTSPFYDLDGVEIQNFAPFDVSLAGYQIEYEGAFDYTYTFPANAYAPANGLVFALKDASPSFPDDLANGVYWIGTTSGTSSSSVQGYILKDPSGNIVDVVALNGHSFSAATGVTVDDWTGNIPNSGGDAGVSRTAPTDNNSASDWTVASFAPVLTQTFGTPNPGLAITGSGSASNVSWSGPNGFTATADTICVGPVLDSGNITYYVSAIVDGCVTNDSAVFYVYPQGVDPIAPVIDTAYGNPDTTFCAPSPRFITAEITDLGLNPSGIDTAYMVISAVNGSNTFDDTVYMSLDTGTATNGSWTGFLPALPFIGADVTISVCAIDSSGNQTCYGPELYLDSYEPSLSVTNTGDSIPNGSFDTLSVVFNEPNGATASSYSWSGPGGFTGTGSSVRIGPLNFPAGDLTYIVTATYAGGCTVTDSVTFYLYPPGLDLVAPVVDSLYIDPDSTLCDPGFRIIFADIIDGGSGPVGVDDAYLLITATDTAGNVIVDSSALSLSSGTPQNGQWSGFYQGSNTNGTELEFQVCAIDSSGNSVCSSPLLITESFVPPTIVFLTDPGDTVTVGDSLCMSLASGELLKITEVELGNTDYMEISNVGNSPIDLSNYKIITSDDYSIITDVNSDVVSPSTTLAGGQTITYSDGSIGSSWPSNLFWNNGSPGWIIILNSNDEIVDAIFWDWSSTDIQNSAITVPGTGTVLTISDEWSGAGVTASSVILRTGGSDNNEASDFITGGAASTGTLNSQLQLPFSGGQLTNLTWSGPSGFSGSGDTVCVGNFISVGPNVFVVSGEQNGCTYTDSVTIYGDLGLGKNTLTFSSELSIFPNPTTGSITISGLNENFNLTRLSIVDLSGKEVMNRELNDNMNHLNIDLSSIKPGAYFIKILDENETVKIEKIIRQ